jgi:hypothetical protein
MKVRLFWAADQTLPIPDIRKTLQVLSCKVYGGERGKWFPGGETAEGSNDLNESSETSQMLAARASDAD